MRSIIVKSKSISYAGVTALAIFTLTLICATEVTAQTFKVIHDFGNGDGDYPQSPLIFGADGNLYGATVVGPRSVDCPDFGCGTVFQLVPNADGSWTETVLFQFDETQGSCARCMYRAFDDGPSGPLALDNAGNLYGTAGGGGSGHGGTAYKLTHQSNGGLLRIILHNFTRGWDGGGPWGLVYTQGHLYGATSVGGAYGAGVVFDLAPSSPFNWYELIVRSFGGDNDGTASGWLTADAGGNIYGTTAQGGSHGQGTVFRLTPNQASFGWTYTDLYDFTGGADGSQPNGFVIFDAAGNLYGTAYEGAVTGGNCGSSGCGAVFKLTPNSDGSWSETVLYAFQGGANDGAGPNGGVTFGRDGNLYGATAGGGGVGVGTLFKLTPAQGQWTETVLHEFDYSDGGNPIGGLVLDGAGNLFGVTAYGGPYVGQADRGGTAFEITP